MESQSVRFLWKHISTWAFPPDETPPVFGQRMRNGRYAWEITGLGMRFEDILRSNNGSFRLSTESRLNSSLQRFA